MGMQKRGRGQSGSRYFVWFVALIWFLMFCLLMLFSELATTSARAHGTHLSDIKLSTPEHTEHADGGMYVRNAEGMFFIYKSGDFTHQCLHVEVVGEDEPQCDTDMDCMSKFPEKGDF